MSFLFSSDEPLDKTLIEWLENPVPSSVLSPSDNKSTSTPTNSSNSINSKQYSKCYYGDSSSPSLEFFYGCDIPKNGISCENGLFSYGQQTQMHTISILYKYPYIHPIGIIYSLLFLWFINFKIRIITIIIIIFILFIIGESMKIHRHSSMENFKDKIQIIATFIGDILLIPFQIFIFPFEYPLIQFQNTEINKYIFSNCKSMFKFTPTFWARNTLLQFIFAVLEEQYAIFNKCKIYREIIPTNDKGIVALDYWIDNKANKIDMDDEKECDEFTQFKDIYKSKYFYQYNENIYNKYEFSNDNLTPILFIFTTYCGDSMSMPVRKIAQYFCLKGWRVISYCKRGCGSPYYEMLPLITNKIFDLSGMDDAQLVIEHVYNKYPLAPKICLGFSLGGSQIQDVLTSINLNKKYFIGGIKIDGMNTWLEMISFNKRLKTISKVLGEIVHSNYIKSLDLIRQNGFDDNKIDYDKIIGIKSSECEIVEMIENVMCPMSNNNDISINEYLHSVGPNDMSLVNVPVLVLNSWNDGFQDPNDMPIGIANINQNIIHCITRLGAHCMRREGILNKHCWQSKVSFEFAQAIVNSKINHK